CEEPDFLVRLKPADTPLGFLLQTDLGHRRQDPPLFMSELKEVREGSGRAVDGCSRVGLPSTRADRRELVGLPRADPRCRDVGERSPGAELRLELIQVELVEGEGPLPRLRLEILLDGLAERHQRGRLRLLLLGSEQIRSEPLLSVLTTPGRVHYPDLSHTIRVKHL